MNRLLDALTPDKPSEIHENAAALWTEFVKALRDIQYNVEVFEDELLDSLQSESSVRQLLQQMFPEKEEEYCSSVSFFFENPPPLRFFATCLLPSFKQH